MSKEEQQTSKQPSGVATVAAAIAIQLTLGIAYLWGIFQKGVSLSIFNGNEANAGLTFSILLATLTVGSVFGGKLAAKYSTRRVVFIGGVILASGFLAASFVTSQNPWLLWITYGVMGGTGMGFTYSTTIAAAQKWYPHKRGLITGVIVSALGFGGVIFTPVIEGLVKAFGGRSVGEPKTFMVLAGVFLTVCTVGCLFIKNPPAATGAAATAAAAAAKNDVSPSQMLRKPQFYIITLAFALACMGGLMIINHSKSIAEMKGFEPDVAAIGVIAISLFNSCGRLMWGIVSDKIGRINTIIILTIGSVVPSLLIGFVQSWFIFALIGLIGLLYGGLLSCFPSLTADVFGAKHLATNYGFVLLGFGSGAIAASQISGKFKNAANIAINEGISDGIAQMFPAFVIGASCATASMLLIVLLRSMTKKAAKQS